MLDKELNLRRELAELPSDQLRILLRAETEKETPDDDLVLMILHILEDREPDEPEPASAREEAAWKLYKKRIQTRKRKNHLVWKGLAHAAVILVVIGLLFSAVPQQAEADSLWDVIMQWVNGAADFFTPEEEKKEVPFVFQTDNPGLQQIYDAAVELGIEQPLVPTWFPEEYTFEGCTVTSTPRTTYIVSVFSSDEKDVVFQISISDQDNLHGYFGEEEYYKKREREGAKYKTMRNNDRWTAVWTLDKIEYSFTMDCQEDTLQRILDSIYVMEE